MVFSSLPAYHDPANWQQQPNHPNIIPSSSSAGMSSGSHQLLPPPAAPTSLPLPPPPPPLQPHGGGGGAGSIRPGSMADRARMANIPMPETALKCPRCESANTKFCYFNNYSLSQPRHFCKTCRRYWTRGGALRNVPVGGGCRRNKRTKGSSGGGGGSSKSPVSSSDNNRHTGGSMTTSGSSGAVPSGNNDILGLAHQVPPGLRFMTPLHHQLTHHHDFVAAASSDHNLGFNYGGLNYGAMSAPMGGGADLNFHIGSSALSGPSNNSLFTGFEQWRMQQPPQFPFLASGLDPASAGLFESDGSGYQPRPKQSSSGITHQMASVKMEDNNHHHQQQHELNLSRQLMGSDQYWSGGGGGGANSGNNAWTTDPSGFSSSSTTSNQL
ncbi:hypothetical protein CsatA_022949 [Cannabis sativa]